MVDWDRTSGNAFSDGAIDYLLGVLRSRIAFMTQAGVPGVSEIHVGRMEIESFVKVEDLDFVSDLVWREMYATKHGMETDDVERLVQTKEEEYQTKLADDASQAMKTAVLSQSADSPEPEKEGPLALKVKRRRDAPIAEALPAAVQAARESAREHASSLIDSLPSDESEHLIASLLDRRYALRHVEHQLFEKLIGEGEQSPMTIHQAIQSVSERIAEDYQSWVAKQSQILTPDDDSPEADESDDDREARAEREWNERMVKKAYDSKK